MHVVVHFVAVAVTESIASSIDPLQLTSQPHQCTSVRLVGVPSTQLYVLHNVVIWAVVGCSRSSKRGKGVGFFRLPAACALAISHPPRRLGTREIQTPGFAVGISCKASTFSFRKIILELAAILCFIFVQVNHACCSMRPI